MWLGYQGKLIAAIAKTKAELENNYFMTFTKLKKVIKPVEMINGIYYVGQDDIDKAKQEIVRKYRNSLLETEVDPVVSNPLRWEDMSAEDKKMYKDYRQYLLNYTKTENWWLKNPLTLEEWKK